MNCHDTQNLLLENPLDATGPVRDHLSVCPDCRRFAALHRRLLELPADVPSPALDQAVLEAAAFRLARRQRRQRQRWLAAAAAVLLLAGWLAAIGLPKAEQGQQIASAPAPLGTETASVWADGQLETALKTLETEARLLSQPVTNDKSAGDNALPTFKDLDSQMFDFELHFYFERAVLGTMEGQANG